MQLRLLGCHHVRRRRSEAYQVRPIEVGHDLAEYPAPDLKEMMALIKKQCRRARRVELRQKPPPVLMNGGIRAHRLIGKNGQRCRQVTADSGRDRLRGKSCAPLTQPLSLD